MKIELARPEYKNLTCYSANYMSGIFHLIAWHKITLTEAVFCCYLILNIYSNIPREAMVACHTTRPRSWSGMPTSTYGAGSQSRTRR